MTKPSRTAKILIVDDHALVREGMVLRISAQPDMQVCGEADSKDEALLLAAKAHPDLMIIDISLKKGHGIELIKQVKSRHASIKMLVVSGFQESLYAERALRAGAMGYLNKQESSDQLIPAIRTVLAGDHFVGGDLTRRLVARALAGPGDSPSSPIDQLSERELEIFRMIGQGLTSGAIAENLHLSPHTIDSHRENIKRKIGAQNAAELNRLAIQWVLENG